MMAATTEAAKRDTKDTKTESVGGKGPKARYKYCIVPDCKSTTVKTPEKLFFSVPTGERRESWCEVMGRRPPAYKPLSPMCNRFCCEDHFDLEKDMDNYIQWKLMGREGTRKRILKKGVLPHKFVCQREKAEATKRQQMEEKYREEFIENILQKSRERRLGRTLDQTLIEVLPSEEEEILEQRKKIGKISHATQTIKETHEVKKHRVNILKQQITKKVKSKRNLTVSKLPSEEEEILEQRKKIGKISLATQTIKETQEQDIDSYTFKIKIEAEDNYYESNDGDSVLKEWLLQGIDTAGEENSHLLGVDVKVEELDEEFEPELVEIKQENITEDEADVTIATEKIPVFMDKGTPFINVTNHLIEATSNDNKGDDFEPLVKEYTQGMIEETANSLSTKTNNFVITENIRDQKVFERVIIGKQIPEVEDETKNTL